MTSEHDPQKQPEAVRVLLRAVPAMTRSGTACLLAGSQVMRP